MNAVWVRGRGEVLPKPRGGMASGRGGFAHMSFVRDGSDGSSDKAQEAASVQALSASLPKTPPAAEAE